MLKTIQALFPMSKGAFLAVSFVSVTGGAAYVQMQSSMDRIIDLQEKTREDIHEIDVRMTVVEHRLDNSIVFKSSPDPETRVIKFDSDSSYSNPRDVHF
jgi:transcription elongation GreA/GreB family factor